MVDLKPETLEALLEFQRNEITEYNVYLSLAQRVDEENRRVLEKIARDELRHYSILRKYTGRDVEPNAKKVLLYSLMAKIFGVTFAIKLMERGEELAQEGYEKIIDEIPEAATLLQEEEDHENQLIQLLKEERVEYVGSMVLGLNDALVELTGALAGLTLALQNAKLIGVAGLVMGVAASLSMAASEYLSRRSEGAGNPIKGAIYTGTAYIITVALMVSPFLALPDPYVALTSMLSVAILIIGIFSFFVSVVKDQSFKRMFLEMLAISLGVALISFAVGWMARAAFGVEI
ncbi:MAG: VIT1/CCC1 transporter family protein [Candidatus Korarchaeota archaeon]|nr:VIT1/CCC1 transporter family protein [Candidatus Korarchaeota archaeon]